MSKAQEFKSPNGPLHFIAQHPQPFSIKMIKSKVAAWSESKTIAEIISISQNKFLFIQIKEKAIYLQSQPPDFGIWALVPLRPQDFWFWTQLICTILKMRKKYVSWHTITTAFFWTTTFPEFSKENFPLEAVSGSVQIERIQLLPWDIRVTLRIFMYKLN